MEQNPTNKREAPVNNTAAQESTDKMMVILAHAGGIFFGFIPALIVWMMKKDESEYVATQAKEALNFQLTIGIAMFACIMLVFVLIGALLIWLVWLADVIFCIIAAVSTSKGEDYRYPVTLRIIK